MNKSINRSFTLVDDADGSPLSLNLSKGHNNIGIFGDTGHGKTILLKGIISQALDEGLTVAGLEGCASYYLPNVAYLEKNTLSHNADKEVLDLFQLPDLSRFPDVERQERAQEYQHFLLLALEAIFSSIVDMEYPVFDRLGSNVLKDVTKAFFADAEIQRRYKAGLADDFSSEAWAATPTLKDFLTFCNSKHFLSLEEDSNGYHAVQLRLTHLLNRQNSQAIVLASAVLPREQFTHFLFHWLEDKRELQILMISAFLATLRRTLEVSKSLLFIDECYTFFANTQMAKLVDRVLMRGYLFGMQLVVTSQEACEIATQIQKNMTFIFVGKIEPRAIPYFEQFLSYPREVISVCSTERVSCFSDQGRSTWLFRNLQSDIKEFGICHYRPSLNSPIKAVTKLEKKGICRRKSTLFRRGNKHQVKRRSDS